MITLSLIHDYIKPCGMKLEDIIPDFNRTGYVSAASGLSFMSDELEAQKAMSLYANDVYKRLRRKLQK
jgi:hypothetical protein